jgi:hypothetical protein
MTVGVQTILDFRPIELAAEGILQAWRRAETHTARGLSIFREELSVSEISSRVRHASSSRRTVRLRGPDEVNRWLENVSF